MPELTNPATPFIIAILWSPWLDNSAPLSFLPPVIRIPSSSSDILAPNLPRLSTVAFIRSDSFTLNSTASLISVDPSAKQAASEIIGNSSMTLGITDPSILIPFISLVVAVMSATGSPPSSLSFEIDIFPFIAFKTSITPMRVGFIPTFLSVMDASGWQQAATSQKADPLTSHGTLTFLACKSLLQIVNVRSCFSTWAPIAESIRSV